jgi:hypothetical protein
MPSRSIPATVWSTTAPTLTGHKAVHDLYRARDVSEPAVSPLAQGVFTAKIDGNDGHAGRWGRYWPKKSDDMDAVLSGPAQQGRPAGATPVSVDIQTRVRGAVAPAEQLPIGTAKPGSPVPA